MRFEWKVEPCHQSFTPYNFLFIDGVKTKIGFSLEAIDDIKYQHITMAMLTGTKPGQPLDADKELRQALRQEMQQLRLTPFEVQEALDALEPV